MELKLPLSMSLENNEVYGASVFDADGYPIAAVSPLLEGYNGERPVAAALAQLFAGAPQLRVAAHAAFNMLARLSGLVIDATPDIKDQFNVTSERLLAALHLTAPAADLCVPQPAGDDYIPSPDKRVDLSPAMRDRMLKIIWAELDAQRERPGPSHESLYMHLDDRVRHTTGVDDTLDVGALADAVLQGLIVGRPFALEPVGEVWRIVSIAWPHRELARTGNKDDGEMIVGALNGFGRGPLIKKLTPRRFADQAVAIMARADKASFPNEHAQVGRDAVQLLRDMAGDETPPPSATEIGVAMHEAIAALENAAAAGMTGLSRYVSGGAALANLREAGFDVVRVRS